MLLPIEIKKKRGTVMSSLQEKTNISVQELNEMRPEELEILAEFFRSFGDMTRLRIMNVLARGEICVGDLTAVLDMTQSAVSHQLKVLKTSRMVKSRRDGKQILYSLDDEHVHNILLAGIEHIRENG